jgi:serine/threonine-protein kinase
MNNQLQFIKLSQYDLKHHSSGGSAHIFHALPRTHSNPELMIKVLRTSLAKKQMNLKKFNDELELLKQLNHIGIPRFSGNGYISGKPYIAYQHVKGTPVINILNKQSSTCRLPVSDACNIFISLLEILQYLHTLESPVIHNDISPENVIVDDDQWVYLIDYGCAQKLCKGNPYGFSWRGKPSYLSPEQARGNRWDHRSDLYQAGILFYELLTGKKKNPGKNQKEARAYAAEPGHLYLERIPDSLHLYMLTLLSPDPEKRFPSAEACINELKKVRTMLSVRPRIDLCHDVVINSY